MIRTAARHGILRNAEKEKALSVNQTAKDILHPKDGVAMAQNVSGEVAFRTVKDAVTVVEAVLSPRRAR